MKSATHSNAGPPERAYGHFAMATRFEVALPDLDPTAGRAVAETLFKEVTRLELKCSFYRHNSELNRINQRANLDWVQLDGEMTEMLSIAWRLWEGTSQAFDLTVGPLLKRWGLAGSGGSNPTPDLDLVWGMDKIEFDPNNHRIRFHQPGIQLDLGGIAKGYALDICRELLEEQEVENALLHGGTSSALALGSAPDGSFWKIATPDPRRQLDPGSIRFPSQETPLAVFELKNEALSVSSVLGKGFLQSEAESDSVGAVNDAQEKVWLGHVLDPAHGKPVTGGVSAFAMGESAAWMDGLTTALIPYVSRRNQCLKLSPLQGIPDWRGGVTMRDVEDGQWSLLTHGLSSEVFPIIQEKSAGDKAWEFQKWENFFEPFPARQD